jgi:hypothetical protein
VYGAVDFFYIWEDSSGECVGQPSDPTAACPNAAFAYGSTSIRVPAGAARLRVLVSGPFFATLNSVTGGTEGGFGTASGAVTFTY